MEKSEAHKLDWLYIEVLDVDLMNEMGISQRDLTSIRLAMTYCLLEGDDVIVDSEARYIVHYYVDVLDGRKRTIDL